MHIDMIALKDMSDYRGAKQRVRAKRCQLNVFGTHVDVKALADRGLHAFGGQTQRIAAQPQHCRAVASGVVPWQNVHIAHKARDKRVLRMAINCIRRADLTDMSCRHHYHTIAHA